MKKLLCCAVASSMMLAAQATTATFGYTNGALDRTNVFREGSTTKQGLAIKLTKEKTAMLKGCSLTGIETAFGSSRTEGGTAEIFLTTDLTKEPLLKKTVTITSAVKWLNLLFDTPYVITGDEEAIYVGFSAEISTSANLLMSDMSEGIAGYSFAYEDGNWIDVYPHLRGNANIRAIIDDAPAVTDLLLTPIETGGYFKAGTDINLTASVYNFGTEKVTSFDVEVTLGNDDPIKETISGIDIAQGETYSLALPVFSAAASKEHSIKVVVGNVNGTRDMDTADNLFASSMFLYPADMERTILLEGFTGMDCSNCPSGHQTINTFLETVAQGDVVEVMHHAGYSPDLLTMDADLDYTYFYGGSSTFAPAVMLNRTAVPTIDTRTPVMNTKSIFLEEAYTRISNMQPYLSLSLTTTFDPDTRKLKVKVDTYNHVDLPTDVNAMNIILVQDDIKGKQVPMGDGYTHNAVFRGTLTGNSWGIQLSEGNLKAGESAHWEKETVLPESIFSDYWNPEKLTEEEKLKYTIEAVPENMHVVAYVAAHGDSPTTMQVYNTVEVKMGESHTQPGFITAVESVSAARGEISISVYDGRIRTNEPGASLTVVTPEGKTVDGGARLKPGLYIVRAATAEKATTKKILVR